MNETHFVIYMHGDSALARKDDDDVNYADVVSGDEGMNMMVFLLLAETMRQTVRRS